MGAAGASPWARPPRGVQPPAYTSVGEAGTEDLTSAEARSEPTHVWARTAPERTPRRTPVVSPAPALTAQDWVLEAGEPAAADASGADGARSLRQRRLLAGAGAMVVLALLIGWAVGRSGTDSTDAAEDLSSDSAIVTTGTSLATDPTAPAVNDDLINQSTTTTSPETTVARTNRTTTSVPERWDLTTVELDPRASELDIQVVAVTPTGVVEYDTGDGERASFPGRFNSSNGPPTVEAGPDWIRIDTMESSFVSRLYQDRDAPVTFYSQGCCSPPYRQAGSDHFWALEPGLDGFGQRLVETDRRGDATGAEIALPQNSWAMGSDPAGGILVSAPGGTYQVTADGATRVTNAALIALGAQHALVLDCGDDLSNCGLVLVERGSGSTHPVIPVLPEDLPAAEGYWYDAAWGGSAVPTLSPDGRYAPLMANGQSHSAFGVIDLITGEFIRLADYPESSLWWAPDGHNVIFVSNGELYLRDLASGDDVEIMPDERSVLGFAVRT